MNMNLKMEVIETIKSLPEAKKGMFLADFAVMQEYVLSIETGNTCDRNPEESYKISKYSRLMLNYFGKLFPYPKSHKDAMDILLTIISAGEEIQELNRKTGS